MPFPTITQMANYFYYGFISGVDYIKIPRTIDFKKIKKSIKTVKYLISVLEKEKDFKRFFLKFEKFVKVDISV